VIYSIFKSLGGRYNLDIGYLKTYNIINKNREKRRLIFPKFKLRRNIIL